MGDYKTLLIVGAIWLIAWVIGLLLTKKNDGGKAALESLASIIKALLPAIVTQAEEAYPGSGQGEIKQSAVMDAVYSTAISFDPQAAKKLLPGVVSGWIADAVERMKPVWARKSR